MSMQTVRQLALSATMITGLFLGGVLSPRAATAATYYVATDGNDAAPGTQKQPFQTIRQGLRVLSAGDTLYLRGGTYGERIDSNDFFPFPTGTSWDNPVTIASYPDETAVLTADGGGFAPINIAGDYLQYIVFDRLVLDGSNTLYTLSLGSSGAHHIRFQNGEVKNASQYENVELRGAFNEVINSKIYDSQHSYGFYITGHDNLVDGCEIYNNSGYAVHIYDGNFPNTSTDNHIISNNEMYNNGFGRSQAAITVGKGRDCLVYNNIIHDNFGGIDVYDDGINEQIDSNILYNNGWDIQISAHSTGTIVQNNIVH